MMKSKNTVAEKEILGKRKERETQEKPCDVALRALLGDFRTTTYPLWGRRATPCGQTERWGFLAFFFFSSFFIKRRLMDFYAFLLRKKPKKRKKPGPIASVSARRSTRCEKNECETNQKARRVG
mmetsp:Transcript_16771/g.54592  ORF Transcript_16771/g.54592 Transcript_16771/m.54592 type:complete len:124 (+) Transcript_16771:291-662(+)